MLVILLVSVLHSISVVVIFRHSLPLLILLVGCSFVPIPEEGEGIVIPATYISIHMTWLALILNRELNQGNNLSLPPASQSHTWSVSFWDGRKLC
jgi:hypothetical protein